MTYNSDIAILQGGKTIRIGQINGLYATDHPYSSMQRALAAHDPAYLAYFDHFVGGLENRWKTGGSSSNSTIACSGDRGILKLTSTTNANDNVTVTLDTNWLVSRGNTYFEARVASDTDANNRAIEIGLGNVTSITGGLLYTSADATPVIQSGNANSAVFAYNSSESMTKYSCLTVKAAGAPTYDDSGITVGTTYVVLAILIKSSGDVTFYANGVPLVTRSSAIETTALLTPWISLKTLSGSAKSINIDYIYIIGPSGL